MSARLIAIIITGMFITACGGSSSPSAPSGSTPAPAGSTTVTVPAGASGLTTTAYAPNPLTVSTGTTVSWLNNDNTTHTSTSDGNAWSSGDIAPGGRFNFTFTSSGRFTYHCTLHPNMVGTIVVQ